MDIRIASEVLKNLKKDTSPEARLASRWLKADLAADYDLLLRLQILEGAAGVPVDSWWNKPKSYALTKARAAFEKTGINPEWLAERSRSLFNVLQRTLSGAIRSFRLNIEPSDVINNSLMGIPIDTSVNERLERAPYLAGKYLTDKIKKGEETPTSVASGVLTTMLKRKVQNLARHRLEQMSEDEEGRVRDVSQADLPEGWGPAEEASAAEYLANVFFYDMSDPLGDEVRKFMREVWNRNPTRGKYMNYWLDLTESKKPNTYPTVADHFGVAYQTFYSRTWVPAWRDFFSALWNNRPLMNKINQRLLEKHLEPLGESVPREVIDKILPPRKRASLVVRVASIYFFHHCI